MCHHVWRRRGDQEACPPFGLEVSICAYMRQSSVDDLTRVPVKPVGDRIKSGARYRFRRYGRSGGTLHYLMRQLPGSAKGARFMTIENETVLPMS